MVGWIVFPYLIVQIYIFTHMYYKQRDPYWDHLPYISKAVARSKYEEPNSCKTDPGIEVGCAKNGNSLGLLPDSLSLDNTCEPVGFCKFLSHAVLKDPSVIFVALSVPYWQIKWLLDLSSCQN